MSGGTAIGRRGLNAATEERLVRDAWLLTAWWIVVGLACSWILLALFHLRSPALRYPVTAFVMYAIGIVAGTRLWLAAFGRAVSLQPGRFGTAPEAPAADVRFQRRRRDAGALDPVTVVAAIGLAVDIVLWFDAGATLFWLTLVTIAVTTAIWFGLGLLIGMDRLMGDSSSVLLAELAHAFVFGRATPRGLLPRRPAGEALPVILRETWGRGLVFLIFSLVAGVTLIVLLPGAVTLADIFE